LELVELLILRFLVEMEIKVHLQYLVQLHQQAVGMVLLKHQEQQDLEDQVEEVVEIVEELYLKQVEQEILRQLVHLKEIQGEMELNQDLYMVEVVEVEQEQLEQQVVDLRQEQVELE
jgi:hypothetical protein